MKVAAIVQARVCSTRLPAKILLDLNGATALERCIRRVSRIRGVDIVVVATSDRDEDEIVASVAHRLGYPTYRGSEGDVLDRYYMAARSVSADIVVRCTSDCPLIDPAISGRVLDALLRGQDDGGPPIDYASNTLVRRLPQGLDTEVMRMDALSRAHESATELADREHVTRYLYQHRSEFRCAAVFADEATDLSGHRWTLDTLDDYRFLFALYEALGSSAPVATMQEILDVLDARPQLKLLNAHVRQKTI